MRGRVIGRDCPRETREIGGGRERSRSHGKLCRLVVLLPEDTIFVRPKAKALPHLALFVLRNGKYKE